MQATPPKPRSETSRCFLNGSLPLDSLWLLGSTLIGANISWLLLGFLLAQTYTFYTQSKKDPLMLKIFAYSLVFLTAVGETAIEAYIAYVFLVSWGNSRAVVDDVVPLFVQQDLQPLIDATVAIAVQLFFTWRIWRFSQAVWGRTATRFVAALCLLIILMTVCAFATAIFLFAYEMTATGPPDLSEKLGILIWSISTAMADLTITICMVVVLYHAKSSAYYGETRDKISRMLRLTIQTGFLTSILALPIAPIYASEIVGWISFTYFLLGKSYVITLLVNLNSRSSHQPEPGMGVDSPHFPSIAFTTGQNPAGSGKNTTFSSRVASLIHSVTHAVRHTLTTSRIEDRIVRFEKRTDMANHTQDGGE